MDKVLFEHEGLQFWQVDAKIDTAHLLGQKNLSEIQPQVYFQTRKADLNFIGFGQVTFTSNFVDTFEKLGPDFYFVAQRDFDAATTRTYLPQIQVVEFKTQQKTLIIARNESEKNVFKSALTKTNGAAESNDKVSVLSRQETPSLPEWNNLFKKIKTAFSKEVFRKIVPARKVSLKLSQTLKALSFFEKVKKTGNYNFYFSENIGSAFMGSSPERLLAFINNTFHTEAVAGTRPLAKAQELLTSEKDQYEHKLVVEDILHKLDPFVTAIVKDDQPRLIEAKNIAHLKTYIEARPATSDIFSILDSLHPTSAICGMPKANAMEFLKENEAFKREKYAGFLGVLNKSFCDVCVTIRSCEISENTINLYSGVGVVPQSEPESEWQELEDKIKPYLDLLQ